MTSDVSGSVLSNTGNRPNVNGAISYPKTVAEWFNPAVFSAPLCSIGGSGADCYGNLGHNAVRGPGRDNWNMSLLKNFAFTERFHLQFRADAFNMWNHTQFKGDYNNGGLARTASARWITFIGSARDRFGDSPRRSVSLRGCPAHSQPFGEQSACPSSRA